MLRRRWRYNPRVFLASYIARRVGRTTQQSSLTLTETWHAQCVFFAPANRSNDTGAQQVHGGGLTPCLAEAEAWQCEKALRLGRSESALRAAGTAAGLIRLCLPLKLSRLPTVLRGCLQCPLPPLEQLLQ